MSTDRRGATTRMDARIDRWSRELAELGCVPVNNDRYRQLWTLAADALSAFAYESGKAQGLTGAMDDARTRTTDA